MAEQPTARPWRYQAETHVGFGAKPLTRYEIYTERGIYGHPATCDLEEDARLIVRAANAHDELVEALEKIREAKGPYSRDRLTHAENTIERMCEIAAEALARAREHTEPEPTP